MKLLHLIVLLGGPGLVLGVVSGALLPRWRPLAALALVSAAAFWYGFTHVPDDPDEDDDPAVLVAIAVATNFGGWLVGLVIGAGAVRVRRRT